MNQQYINSGRCIRCNQVKEPWQRYVQFNAKLGKDEHAYTCHECVLDNRGLIFGPARKHSEARYQPGSREWDEQEQAEIAADRHANSKTENPS